MAGKDMQELRELVEFLKASGIAEFEMERPDMKVGLKFVGAAAPGCRWDRCGAVGGVAGCDEGCRAQDGSIDEQVGQ